MLRNRTSNFAVHTLQRGTQRLRLRVTMSQNSHRERRLSGSLVGERRMLFNLGREVGHHLLVDPIHDRMEVWKRHWTFTRGIDCGILMARRLVLVIRVEGIRSAFRR